MKNFFIEDTPAIINHLLASTDPCIQYKARLRLLGESPASPPMQQLANQVRASDRVQGLLSQRDSGGRVPGDAYAKFYGAHWILAVLADIDYPQGDPGLIPLRDQVYARWLNPAHAAERAVTNEASRYKSRGGVPIIQGRARRCASQEGNALWSTLKLGIADARADQLASNLVRWQWPDGGWNCDRKTQAVHSSFHESLIPLRALSLHARLTGWRESQLAADRAAEVFLKRHLFKRQRDGEIMDESFVRLHFPPYWHYDYLFGLKVLVEAGKGSDPRCTDAFQLLVSNRLDDGGFPAQRKHYRVVQSPMHGGSLVDWGGTSKRRMNEWVTLDALIVLNCLTTDR